jgi:hypothetical protein
MDGWQRMNELKSEIKKRLMWLNMDEVHITEEVKIKVGDG